MKNCIALFLLTLVFAGTARAEFSVRDYEKSKSNPLFKAYISGIANGFSWANTTLRMKKQPRLYCEPDKLSMNADNYLNILDRELNDNSASYTLDTPLPLVLLVGLAKTFPCQADDPSR